MLDKKRFGYATGILWGGILCVLTLVGLVFTDYAQEFFEFLSFYPGYQRSLLGALLGLVWGFLDGFIAGYLFAWIYNALGRQKQ